MGHLHERELKKFHHLGGPISYPGSIELTSSEGIKETQKGFYEVDISSSDAKPNWIRLDTRPQYSVMTSFENLAREVNSLSEKIQSFSRKPIVEIKIQGDNIETDLVQSQIAKLFALTLRCFWKTIIPEESEGSVFIDKPAKIDDEMLKLAKDILNSESLANFAINDLLPLLSKNQIGEANHLVIENYNQFKKGLKKC